jgi:hypothetical protein
MISSSPLSPWSTDDFHKWRFFYSVLWIAGKVGRSSILGYQKEEEVLIERTEEEE